MKGLKPATLLKTRFRVFFWILRNFSATILIKNESPAQVFSCEFRKVFQFLNFIKSETPPQMFSCESREILSLHFY